MSDNGSRVYLGKVLKRVAEDKSGEKFETRDLVIENPLAVNKDGSPNPYHKGSLIFRDLDGKEFLIKKALFRGVGEKAAANGFTASLAIDLNDKYLVEEIVK